MAHHLVLYVALHDRFHGMAFGAPEWPPSPARVFQALLAGVARGRAIPERVGRALAWLETLSPPRIGTPRSKQGGEQTFFVPNNDLDSVGGDPARIAEVRVSKRVVPRLLERTHPLFFLWSWNEPSDFGPVLVEAAEQLYQLGRGVDLAWARGELLDDERVERLLATYPGTIFIPSEETATNAGTQCPIPGSLESLQRRFAATRIREVVDGGKRRQIYETAPKPLFRPVRYNRKKTALLYDLVHEQEPDRAYPASLSLASWFVEALRDAAADKLRRSFPAAVDDIERRLIGRKADGSDAGPAEERVRIIPLPSIGHEHADLALRRVAIEIPAGSTLSTEDWAWGFDSLTSVDSETGEVGRFLLIPAQGDASMLDRYARPARRFHSVTPVVLPEAARRRRIDPAERGEQAKGGPERAQEEVRASSAVRTAIRHAGIRASAESIRVQREPFERRGSRAESFAEGTRFPKERLWHVEITFDRPVQGPLVIGDGRFLGLGVMAPSLASSNVFAFKIEDGLAPDADPAELTRALRRAVMARVQQTLGAREQLPSYFSGHDRNGEPLKTERDAHLLFGYLPDEATLLVVPPHVTQHRPPFKNEREHLAKLDEALSDLRELRAGSAGLLSLRCTVIDPTTHQAFAPSTTWRTATPYQVTRHGKKVTPNEALEQDVRAECARRGLPEGRIVASGARGVSGVGLIGNIELRFARAVPGPILLGRNRHFGGGLFVGVTQDMP